MLKSKMSVDPVVEPLGSDNFFFKSAPQIPLYAKFHTFTPVMSIFFTYLPDLKIHSQKSGIHFS